jgi:tetratricopeptide (TPR) repeat protein
MADEEPILDPEIERLSERLGKDPDSLVFAPLADAYRRSGLIEEAIDVLRKGMEKHPNYASAFIVLGRCYQDQKMYELARSEFEKALEVDRDNLLASKLYAAVLVPLGRKDEAVERYHRLLEIDPTNAEIQKALEDLASQPDTVEEKKDLSSEADMGVFSFGDIGSEESSERAPEFGDIFPGPEPGGEEAASTPPQPVDTSPAPEPAEQEAGGRSPFDFGTIPEAAGGASEEKKNVAPPAFLEPTVVGKEGTTTSKHDLGGVDETPPAQTETARPQEKEEDIVLPKPSGRTAFVAPPGLDASIGREIDAELAEIYFEHGFREKAIVTYERLLEADPDRSEYGRRLAELKGEESPAETPKDVFPSEILDPFSDRAPKEESSSQRDAGEFSEAATPEGDQTISLSDLFTGGKEDESAEGSLGSPHPSQAQKREDEERKEKEQPKGGFDSFQSWLDGLGK